MVHGRTSVCVRSSSTSVQSRMHRVGGVVSLSIILSLTLTLSLVTSTVMRLSLTMRSLARLILSWLRTQRTSVRHTGHVTTVAPMARVTCLWVPSVRGSHGSTILNERNFILCDVHSLLSFSLYR
nr:MAG TPA: hypothetical protein [Caudoviricetes sp.]